jgi:hypothetical protein
MKKEHTHLFIVGGATALIVGSASFFGGVQYQRHQLKAQRDIFGMGGFGQRVGRMGMGMFGGDPRGGQFGGRGGGGGFRPVMGEVLNSDGSTLTVKLMDGSSKIVVLSQQTMINKAAQANAEDLKVGEKVAVFGQENADGTVTAQSVQINPLTRMGGTPSASPSAIAKPSSTP